MRILLPGMPDEIRENAVKAPDMPEPMIMYSAVSGVGVFLLALRWGKPRVVLCQYDRHGEGRGREGSRPGGVVGGVASCADGILASLVDSESSTA